MKSLKLISATLLLLHLSGDSISTVVYLEAKVSTLIINGLGTGQRIGNYINEGNLKFPCIKPVENITATCLDITCKPLLGGFICIPHGCNTDDRDLQDLCNNITMPALNQIGMTVHKLNSATNYTQPLNNKPCDFVDLLPARHCCNEFCMSKDRVTNGTCDYHGNFLFAPYLSNVTTLYDSAILNKLGNYSHNLDLILNQTGKGVLETLVNLASSGVIITGNNITVNKTGACFCQGEGTPDICNLVNQENKGNFTQVFSNGKLFTRTDGYPEELEMCKNVCKLSPFGCVTNGFASDGVSYICVCYCPTRRLNT